LGPDCNPIRQVY
jgi:NAD+ kinase